MSLLGGVGADDVVIETTVQPMNRRPRAGTLRIRHAQVTDSRELEWVLELQRVPGDAASKALSDK